MKDGILFNPAIRSAEIHRARFETSMPYFGGTLVPFPDLVVPQVETDSEGRWLGTGRWPDGIPSDSVFYFQAWIVDPSAPQGLAASNALSARTP